MALSSEELERIADELYLQRTIPGSVYCGNCGYNLRTLPYIYTCPECGNPYNARPRKLIGIFRPEAVEPPTGDIATTIFCALATLLLTYRAIVLRDTGLLVIALVFVALSVAFGVKSCRRSMRFLKARMVARRIDMEEEEG